MPSDMTTAEMVAQIRKYHANTEAVGPHEYDAQMLAIAARLEALDRVARAGKAMLADGRVSDFTEFVCEESTSIVLRAALKEAGYGT